MTARFVLEKSGASGPLLPATLTRALAREASPRATLRGQVLRIASKLALDDDACAAFTLDFVAQGDRVRASANGPSAALLAWAFHVLADRLDCTVEEGLEDEPAVVDASPDAKRDDALAYLTRHEADVEEARRSPADALTGARFLAWLAREEHVALAEDEGAVASFAASLAMNDASELYASLLDSDAVDDVFVSERELVTLLERFRARVPNAPSSS